MRALISLLGLAAYVIAAWFFTLIYFYLAGPWQIHEMGDGPSDRPLSVMMVAYILDLAGLFFYCRACFRWIIAR